MSEKIRSTIGLPLHAWYINLKTFTTMQIFNDFTRDAFRVQQLLDSDFALREAVEKAVTKFGLLKG